MAGLALPRAQLLQDHHCPRARTIPRLRQTSPPHCTSTRSSNTPLGSTVRALCPTYMRRRMHTKSGTATKAHPHALATTRRRTHTRTNARSHAGREGHSHVRRWVQRHRGDESKGYQRREHQSDDHRPAMRRWVQRHRGDESKGHQRRKHQSDDHRPAANAKQSSGLM